MVGAPRFNYLSFVAIGVFWILPGLYYLIGGLSGLVEFDMFGVRTENAYVLFGVFEIVLGVSWLSIVTRRYDGEVSFGSRILQKSGPASARAKRARFTASAFGARGPRSDRRERRSGFGRAFAE